MRQLGILLFSSIVAAACASNPPPEASSATVAQATNVPNNGPDFTPAETDGMATARAEKRAPADATQPAPDLNAPPATGTASANNDTTNNTRGNGTEGGSAVNPSNAAASPAVRSPDADNTAVNKRDRSGKTLTPMDQGSSQADRATTTQIRQALMHDSTLSFTAKNVKIITINGKVTLRGTVKTDAERTTIENAARNVAGGAQVDSQLEVSK
ncbi:MAG: BON domain-containing protein [Pseudomonadota bacterium]